MEKSYKQISEEYGITMSALYHRANRLNIKGRFKSVGTFKRVVFFDRWQVSQLVSCSPRYFKNSRKKIDVIELYQKRMNGREIAAYLGISTIASYETIKEYEQTKTIIVESELSRTV